MTMKIHTKQSTILFLFAFAVYVQCMVSWNGTEPDGYLLGFKVVEIIPDPPNNISGYNHASLFRIDFDGTVTEFWNHTLNPDGREIIFQYNLFTVDTENELVYVGVNDQFLALDLETGIPIIDIRLKPPHLQIFSTYDYFPKNKSIYGFCIGNGPYYYWYWCHVNHTGLDKVEVEYLYTLPEANTTGPITNIYHLNQEEQLIWYYPGNSYLFAIAVNITTAEVVFVSGMSPDQLDDQCIVHDRSMDRVFTYVWYNNPSSYVHTSVGLGELFPKPKERKILLNLSHFKTLVPSQPGTCAYDQTTHTMMVLMRNCTDYDHQMPTGLLLIDTVSLTYKLTPLPMFRQNWDSKDQVSAIKLISNSQ